MPLIVCRPERKLWRCAAELSMTGSEMPDADETIQAALFSSFAGDNHATSCPPANA